MPCSTKSKSRISMKTPSTSPANAVSMPRPPMPKRPKSLAEQAEHHLHQARPTMPNIAAMTNVRNFVPTLMLKNL